LSSRTQCSSTLSYQKGIVNVSFAEVEKNREKNERIVFETHSRDAFLNGGLISGKRKNLTINM
jgi:hypothetical protein